MSVANVANLPCRYLTENPLANARTHNRSALMYNILEKVSWVAFTAIMAAVFTIYYTGIVLTGAAPFLVGAMILSTIPIIMLLPKFRINANHHAKLAQDETRVAQELQRIQDWKEPRIEQFLREQGLIPEQVQAPLVSLLPLIARYNAMKQEAGTLVESARRSLAANYEEVQDMNMRVSLVWKNRFLGRHTLETNAIPAALNAAVMLRMIQNPRLNVQLQSQTDQGNLEIPGLGRCIPVPLGGRDAFPNYFYFNPRLNRAPLTIAEIEENTDPAALYLKLFPNAMH